MLVIIIIIENIERNLDAFKQIGAVYLLIIIDIYIICTYIMCV